MEQQRESHTNRNKPNRKSSNCADHCCNNVLEIEKWLESQLATVANPSALHEKRVLRENPTIKQRNRTTVIICLTTVDVIAYMTNVMLDHCETSLPRSTPRIVTVSLALALFEKTHAVISVRDTINVCRWQFGHLFACDSVT